MLSAPDGLARRICVAATTLWIVLFSIHTLGALLALRQAPDKGLAAGMLLETAPTLLVLIGVAITFWGRLAREHHRIGPLSALGWMLLPPISDYLIVQPVSSGIVLALNLGGA